MKKIKNKVNLVRDEVSKYYDLEDRTLKFAKDTLAFLRKTNRNIENQVVIKQLARSSTSIGANYIEANNYLGKKDFAHKIGICKKEAKETIYWLKLICFDEKDKNMAIQRDALVKESTELMFILAAIHRKTASH